MGEMIIGKAEVFILILFLKILLQFCILNYSVIMNYSFTGKLINHDYLKTEIQI